MKAFLIIFCSVTLIASITVVAYNSSKGPAKQKDGISELPQPVNDSMVRRGKQLLDKMNYSGEDLQAIYVYLRHNK